MKLTNKILLLCFLLSGAAPIWGFSSSDEANGFSNPALSAAEGSCKNKSYYPHGTCSRLTCYESCIVVKWGEFIGGDLPTQVSADTMILDIAMDCLGVRAAEVFTSIYTASKNLECGNKCLLSATNPTVENILQCTSCALSTAIGKYISRLRDRGPAAVQELARMGGCALTLWGTLGELAKPHVWCIAECASPVHSWERNWGHECRDDVSPDIYRCDEFGLDLLQKYSCQNCEYRFENIAQNCASDGRVCVQSRRGGVCASESGSRGGSRGGDGDVDIPDPPGNDRPDDSYSVSGLYLAQASAGNDKKLHKPVAVLKRGYHVPLRSMLKGEGIPSTLFQLKTRIDPDTYPLLVIPSGGLYGIRAGSVRAWLEDYVSKGGTLVVFAQQHGYDYAVLPGGEVGGYGWVEDQQCQFASVVISSYIPAFAGLNTTLDANVDGFFTAYPANTTVLLSRTKNGQPAMLMYSYGNGTVIATTLYSDMAKSMNQGTEDERRLIRNLLLMYDLDKIETYPPGSITVPIEVYNPKPSPTRYPVQEFSAGDVVTLTANVTNFWNASADKVSFVVFDPAYNVKAWVNVSEVIGANESRLVNFSYALPASARSGIWSVLYLLSRNGSFVSAGYAAEFAVNYSIEENSKLRAIVTLRNTSGDVVREENLSAKVLPGRRGSINISLNTSEEGLWTARYTIFNSEGKVHISDAKRFAVSRYTSTQGGFGYHGSEITLTVTSDREEYPYGSPAIFVFHLWNHGSEDKNATVTWGLIRHYSKGVVPRGVDPWYHSFNKTVLVPARGNASFTYTLPEVRELDRLRANVYVDGTKVGSAERGLWMYHPDLKVNLTTKGEYMYGEVVMADALIESRAYLPEDRVSDTYRITLRVLDRNNRLVDKIEKEFGLAPLGNECYPVYSGRVLIESRCKYYAHFAVPVYLPLNITPGAYFAVADVEGNAGGKWVRAGYGSTYFVVKSSSVGVGFRRAYYRAGETLNIEVVVPNNRNVTWNQTLNLSIPSLSFSDTRFVNLSPREVERWNYSFRIPESITPGFKLVLLTRVEDGETLYTGFYIPEAELRYSLETLGSKRAGENITSRLENTGGVAANYSYSFLLRDIYDLPVLNESLTGRIEAGGVIRFNHTIPAEAVSRYYVADARMENLGTGDVVKKTGRLRIDGLKAALDAATDRGIYLTGDNISVLVNVTSAGKEIKNATLKLRVLATKPVVVEKCVVPKDDLIINKSTKLCPGTYYIPDGGWAGVIIIKADNVVVDGTDVTIRGAGSGNGVYNRGYDNVTIQNLRVENYRTGIYLGNSAGSRVEYATLNTNRYGVRVEGSSSITVKRTSMDSNTYGIYGKESHDVSVLENTLTNSPIYVYDDDWGEQYNWRIEENSITLPPGSYYAIRLETEEYDFYSMTIRNNSITGGRYGIYLYDNGGKVYNISVLDNTLRNQSYYGIYSRKAENITIANNTIADCGSRGIYLEYARNNTLKHNTITGASCGFDIKGWWAGDFVHTVESNTVNGMPIVYLLGESDVVINASLNPAYVGVVNSRNITVRDLVMSGRMRGVLFAKTSSSRIINVTALNNDYGITLMLSDNNTLRDNYVNSSMYRGIEILGSSFNLVENNTVLNSAVHGVYVSDGWNFTDSVRSTGNILSNNTIERSGSDGVRIDDAVEIRLSYNLIADNRGNGVVGSADSITLTNNNISYNSYSGVSGAQRGSIANNWVSHNGLYGISYLSFANVTNNTLSYNNVGMLLRDANRVENNTVSYNTNEGIRIWGSHNLLASNTAKGNRVGIKLLSSWGSYLTYTNNTLTGNTLISNTDDGIYIYASFYNTSVLNNTAAGNKRGIAIYAPSSSLLQGNLLCSNSQYDIYNASANASGYGNTCNTTYNWNDANASGCTYACGTFSGLSVLSYADVNAGVADVAYYRAAERHTQSLNPAGAVERATDTLASHLATLISALATLKHSVSNALEPVWAEEAALKAVSQAGYAASSPASNSSGVIWEKSRSVNISGQVQFQDVVPRISQPGKYYLHAVLYSPTGQVIAETVVPFYVTSSNLVLTLETNKKTYRSGEEVTISGNVTNLGTLNESNLTVTLSADSTPFASIGPFNLAAGESHAFTSSYTPSSSFTLSASVDGFNVSERIRVENLSLNASLVAPEVAGIEPFDAGVEILNTGNLSANITVEMLNHSWSVEVPAGGIGFVGTSTSIRENTTINATLSGDLNLSLSKRVAFGANASIALDVEAGYPEGEVEIPFVVNNTGMLEVHFNASFEINGAVKAVEVRLPPGGNTSGSVAFNLSRGMHTLRYTSPLWNGTLKINVNAPPSFEIIAFPQNASFTPGEVVNLSVAVKNTGGSRGMAVVNLESEGLFNSTEVAWIEAGEAATLNFTTLIPDDVMEGRYPLAVRAGDATNRSWILIQGANISVSAGLDRALYREGENATLTLRVTNLNSLPLELLARVQLGSFAELRAFNLSGRGNTTLSFSIPVDLSSGKLLYAIYMSSGRSLYINSLYIPEAPPAGAGITLYTDRQVYDTGDTAKVQIAATKAGTLSLTAPNFSYSASLSAGEARTLSFTVPALLSGSYSIDYNFSGYELSYPFDVRGYFARILELKMDKEGYLKGENFTLSARIEANKNFNATVKIHLFDPELRRIADYSFPYEFREGENELTYSDVIDADIPGLYIIVPRVVIDLPDHSPVVLVSGAKYFDVAVYNTLAGKNVKVELLGVTITFENVTANGTTSVDVQATGPELGSNFKLAGYYYDITTTASYSGNITVCIGYNESGVGDENNLRLLHRENNTWMDVTSSIDTASNIICGEVSSFSDFIVAEIQQAAAAAAEAAAPAPGGAYSPEAVLLANSIDLALAQELVAHLKERGIKLYVVSAANFSDYSTKQYIIILGGYKAYEGVGDIVAGILSEDEKAEVEEGRAYIKKRSVFRKGGIAYIFAGRDRNATREAWMEAYEEVAREIEYNWG